MSTRFSWLLITQGIKTNMLLIIILGLLAKLMSVSGDCDIGTQLVNDFDWNKFTGPKPWYDRYHISGDFENNFDCVEITLASPVGNWSLVTAKVYDIRHQRQAISTGNATNWNSNGYYDNYHPVQLWNGRMYIIATDYDRYAIAKLCPLESKEAYIYVAFRQRHPNKETVEEVMKVMQDSNIDVSQLVEWSADHC